MQQVLKANFLGQKCKSRVNSDIDQPAVAFRERLFQPAEGFLLVIESRVEHGPIVRRDVLLTAEAFEFEANLASLRRLSRQRIGVRQFRLSRSLPRRDGTKGSQLTDA